jgi:hypothetical protein
MTTFYINVLNLIIVPSTCFEHPSVHPQVDLYMQFYGISFQARPAIDQTACMDE